MKKKKLKKRLKGEIKWRNGLVDALEEMTAAKVSAEEDLEIAKQQVGDLVAKVQYLLTTYSHHDAEGKFTFPDGDTWTLLGSEQASGRKVDGTDIAYESPVSLG